MIIGDLANQGISGEVLSEDKVNSISFKDEGTKSGEILDCGNGHSIPNFVQRPPCH
jgi:hypothetical protein